MPILTTRSFFIDKRGMSMYFRKSTDVIASLKLPSKILESEVLRTGVKRKIIVQTLVAQELKIMSVLEQRRESDQFWRKS
jgi:hypothetical protein